MNFGLLALLSGFALWTASDLQRIGSKLTGRRFASQTLGDHMMLASRQGGGSAELHETEADVFFVRFGTASLVIGGTIVSPKKTAPHEIRGASIQNGTVKRLSAGDLVHIPARTPHQLIVGAGQQFTYFVVKVRD